MRTYGGRTAQQRREERRRTLLDVGRELWCEQGWAAVTMRGVCARAELSDRYFYESFADREALLVAIAEDVRDETVGLLLGTGIDPQTDSQVLWLRRALEIIVDHVDQNPGSAQIFFGDHGGNELLESLHSNTIAAVVELFLDFVRPRLLPGVTEPEVRIMLLVGIGGFVETIAARRAGNLVISRDELIEILVRMAHRLATDVSALS